MRYFVKCILTSLSLTGLFTFPLFVYAQSGTLAGRLSGRILIQVEQKGEAWYVDPVSLKRYFLGRPEDAYRVMRSKGLGIRHQDLVHFLSTIFPTRLAGRILLDVEQHGEAYYIVPNTRRGVYLGRQSDAFKIMRAYGLGISNANLGAIGVAIDSATSNVVAPPTDVVATPSVPVPAEIPTNALEKSVFDSINLYRQSKGLSVLAWSNVIADAARGHSQNMATGTVAFSHEGFSKRVDAIDKTLKVQSAAENVAYNGGFEDPAETAVAGWLKSPGHLENIVEPIYTQTGIGVAQSVDGNYYFTQMFIHPME